MTSPSPDFYCPTCDIFDFDPHFHSFIQYLTQNPLRPILPPMTDIRSEIQAAADRFVQDVMEALARQFLGGPAPAKAAPKRGPAKSSNGAKHDNTAMFTHSIMEALKRHPEGMRSETLKAEVRTDDLLTPIKILLESGKVVKEGERRATTYKLAPSRPDPGRAVFPNDVEEEEPPQRQLIPRPPKGQVPSGPGRVIRRKKA